MEIIKDALNIIGEYCLNSCEAECCKRGSLKLDGVRVKLNPCPKLINDRCSIYSNRPKTCSDYPIRKAMLGDKEIIIINKCKAVDSGIVNTHINKIEKLGYKIYKTNNHGNNI